MLVICYVDDAGLAAKSKEQIDQLIQRLTSQGFELTREGTFSEYLGIKFVRNDIQRTFTLTQKGLISKIVNTTGLTNCNGNWTPTTQLGLGIDPDGTPMQENWSYSSVVGMLLYLATNTRPDISFAVSQVARFNHSPKQSHASAVKTIVRYLHKTCEMGMIVKPTNTLQVDCYVDADFAGLYKRDPDDAPSSVKSRTGYLIKLGGCPLLWKSHLQSEISLSTLEAEYSALSSCMRTLIPLKSLIQEVTRAIRLPKLMLATIRCSVFEDNNGALLLATNQRITNRTKYFQVKWHHFWEHVKKGWIVVKKINTEDQQADFLTKGLSRDLFERNRRSVQGW